MIFRNLTPTLSFREGVKSNSQTSIRFLITLFYLVLITNVASSQITYGKITYERKTNLYKKFKNNGDVKEWLKEEDKNKIDVF